jgi:DNA topoisomerase-3
MAAAVTAAASYTTPRGTTLRIPFSNKEAALQLGARYCAGGSYAPAGLNLNSFRERGWLWREWGE